MQVRLFPKLLVVALVVGAGWYFGKPLLDKKQAEMQSRGSVVVQQETSTVVQVPQPVNSPIAQSPRVEEVVQHVAPPKTRQDAGLNGLLSQGQK